MHASSNSNFRFKLNFENELARVEKQRVSKKIELNAKFTFFLHTFMAGFQDEFRYLMNFISVKGAEVEDCILNISMHEA
jgi:hypothetical protein